MKLFVLCNDRLALPALQQLLQAGIVAGVGMSSREGEVQYVVHNLTQQAGVPFRIFKKKNFHTDLAQWLEAGKPDAVLVKTFPWKIPAELLDVPKFGFINFHYAPLPEYRGSNPLFWMIRDGVKSTGVTVHQMTAEFDDGPIMLRSTVPLHPDSTFGMAITQLGYSGLELTAQLINMLNSGNIQHEAQDAEKAKWYGRPSAEDLWIKWNVMDATRIKRLTDACNPWNKGAASSLNGWMVGVTYVTEQKQDENRNVKPGTILTLDEKNGLQVACADNTVVKIDIVYTEEGFVPGHTLAVFNVKPGMVFT